MIVLRGAKSRQVWLPLLAESAEHQTALRHLGEALHVANIHIWLCLRWWRRAEALATVPSVDPDRGHPELLGGSVVVKQALRDVQYPLARDVDALERELKATHAWLVAARLLRGDDPVELDAEPAIGERRGRRLIRRIRGGS